MDKALMHTIFGFEIACEGKIDTNANQFYHILKDSFSEIIESANHADPIKMNEQEYQELVRMIRWNHIEYRLTVDSFGTKSCGNWHSMEALVTKCHDMLTS